MVSAHTEAADIAAWAIYGGSVIIYHLYIALAVRCLSMKVSLSVMLINNPAWAAKMIRTKGSEITSVQSLRNTIIAATFVGGFAFTSGTTFITQLETVDNTSLAQPKSVRAIVLSALLYSAFLNFAFVVRTASHLSYLMGSATGQLDAQQFPLARRTRTTGGDQPIAASASDVNSSHVVTEASQRFAVREPVDMEELRRQITMETERRVEPPLQALEAADVAERCKKLMRLMSFHFSAGFRIFYCALPVAMYAAGPVALIVGTVVIIFWLAYIDHAVTVS